VIPATDMIITDYRHFHGIIWLTTSIVPGSALSADKVHGWSLTNHLLARPTIIRWGRAGIFYRQCDSVFNPHSQLQNMKQRRQNTFPPVFWCRFSQFWSNMCNLASYLTYRAQRMTES
jgi:hypothetical protein